MARRLCFGGFGVERLFRVCVNGKEAFYLCFAVGDAI